MTSAPDTPTGLLAEIVAAWGQRFAADEDINGGDVVEWLGQWLPRAQAALDAPSAPALPAPGSEADLRRLASYYTVPDSIALRFNGRGGPS